MTVNKLNEVILSSLKDLIDDIDVLIPKMSEVYIEEERSPTYFGFNTEYHDVMTTEFYEFKTRFLMLLGLIGNQNQQTVLIAKEVQKLGGSISNIYQIKGYLLALKNSYEKGLLTTVARIVEAEVVSDYIRQAKNLFKRAKASTNQGIDDYAIAAVLIGIILEDALRRLCVRQIPPISINDPKGKPKTMNPLIDDLKMAGAFNEIKAQKLRSWLHVRNAAAHGKFSEFTATDVEHMMQDVEQFVADHL